jgi:hypothetical protein
MVGCGEGISGLARLFCIFSSSSEARTTARPRPGRYNLAYLLTALGGAYAGLIGLGNNCPYIKDEDNAVNYYKCTVHEIYGTLSGAFAIYQAQGLHRSGIDKRDGSSIGPLDLPYQNTTLVPGIDLES